MRYVTARETFIDGNNPPTQWEKERDCERSERKEKKKERKKKATVEYIYAQLSENIVSFASIKFIKRLLPRTPGRPVRGYTA